MSPHSLGWAVFVILIVTLCHNTGSRPLGDNAKASTVLVNFESLPIPELAGNTSPAQDPGFSTTSSSRVFTTENSESSNNSVSPNPCSLILPPVDGGLGDRIKPVSLNEKEFVRLSHPLFQVGQDVVPGVLYQVHLEIPIESEYSLEYWVSSSGGVAGETHLKRRHQRERKDAQLIELFPDPVNLTSSNRTRSWEPADNSNSISRNTSSSNPPFLQPVSCSKNSVGGINYYREETSQSFTFKWVLKNTHFVSSTVIFRLRFRLITEASSSVYEQLLSLPVRSDCFLKVKVGESTQLALSSLRTPHDLSPGLNCTILLSAQPGFGIEARFTNLSIYGIRELCQGRFIRFTVNQDGGSESESGASGDSSSSHSEFTSLISPLDRKYCGKIEDYSNDERLLTFAGSEQVLLHVSLPGSLKPKETFSLQLTSLSPCQKVLLTQLQSGLTYAKNPETGSSACSIVIHVPYGNSIETDLVFSHGPLLAHQGRGENATEPSPCPNAQDYVNDPDYLVLDVVDSDSSDEEGSFVECVDGRVYTFHKTHWTGIGNKVKISFELKPFDHFSLVYKAVPNSDLTQSCDEGWVGLPDGAGCLTLVEAGRSWTQAEEDCQSRGGHLITVRNDLVQRTVQDLIVHSALFHPSRAYWIGANDRESEGNFQWTSGLPFIFTNWFSGWSHKGNEVLNAQPNDDGFSGQDCVELRQTFSAITPHPLAPFAPKAYYSALLPPTITARKSGDGAFQKLKHIRRDSFHWNDRNCEVKNFYLCEKTTYQQLDFACNRTLRLGLDTTSVPVSSPAYPSTYPDNTHCVTRVETSPGYRLIVEFDEFLLEDSPSCKYDFLELVDGEIDGNLNQSTSQQQRSKSSTLCGDWSKRLKLLRYTSLFPVLLFKFESDFSHHYPGFKAKVWAEKAVSQQCQEEGMVGFASHCYRVLHASQGQRWRDAQENCNLLKGSLTSVVSKEEWRFLTQTLVSSPDFDKKATYWLGGSLDHSNQLVWADRMPFNFSAFHPSDLKSISEWKCLSLYWHAAGKGTFAWRLSDCNQVSGYICKKNTQVDSRPSLNRTFSGTGGSLTSPNYPSAYPNHLDYTNQLTAPPGTQIVVQFLHLDLEAQEDCLYDYIEIVDRRTRNSSRVCGTHSAKDLNKFDFVSSSNGVDLIFHSDFSKNFSGYEIIWRAVDVTECLSGRTILTGLEGRGFHVHPATIHTPNFPYFNLPGLNCVYTIVAPAGQRIYLHFDIFEIGDGRDSSSEEGCDPEDDHVIIHLAGDSNSVAQPSTEIQSKIRICGNLTSTPHQASFISYSEKMVIRVVSPSGRTGRGFLAKIKAVPGSLSETISMSTIPNTSYPLTSLNHPLLPPLRANLTLDFISPPNYVLTVRVQGNAFHNCHLSAGTYVVIFDPYVGTNGTSWTVCDPDSFQTAEEIGRAEAYRRLGSPTDAPYSNALTLRNVLSPIQSSLPITFRSTFNRLEMTQVYTSRFQGSRWNAEISTTIDEDFRAKVLAGGDRLLLHNACSPNPCTNGGKCVTEGDKYICRCQLPYTGPFCGLSVCDLNPCRFGECFVEDTTFRCVCQMGYGGERCDRTSRPCDGRPCAGHGECVEVTNSTYKCLCHAFWEGPRCEARMQQIPFRPLSERMLREPFWLGIITVTTVMGVIGICWCFKRHFPEKLEKFLNEDPERNRGISWVSGRSPSSIRLGGGSSVRESVPGTSSQLATSPQTSRTFLGRFGIRKPSLLSLSSATSVSAAATSPHTYENRTFSLDDLLRPSRTSMMRTPSPHRRRNFSIHGRRDPVEKQQMLQQLMSNVSVDGEYNPASKPSTPKPTIAEIIQMSEKRLRLASMAQQQLSLSVEPPEDKPQTEQETDHEHETSFTTPASKAEKKVTFARLLDKLTAPERCTSSSDSDSCCAEEGCKTVMVHPKPPKKERKGRFRRSRPYNRGRNSETDQDGMEMSSSDTTPDPICPPRFPSRVCGSPTGLAVTGGGKSPSSSKPGSSKSLNKMASADSLLALFRRFSGSSSAPPSPQYSENEESSTGATPLSTPSSPRNSSLSLNFRPPAFLITTAEPNTFELPVIDPFGSQNQAWRNTGQTSNSITLEVPMRDYCLSPIHEVPTPLPTPSHSPAHTPMMHRTKPDPPTIHVQGSSEAEEEHEDIRPRRRTSIIPTIAISAEDEEGVTTLLDGNESDQDVFEDPAPRKRSSMTGETEVIPDVLIHVPPDAPLQSNPNSDLVEETRFNFDPATLPPEYSPSSSPRVKTKPPPLVFANQILSYVNRDELPKESKKELPKMEIPVLNVEYATPIAEIIPNFPHDFDKYPRDHNLPDITSFTAIMSRNPWESGNPLAPPMIMINQSSEAESDSDTPTMRKLLRKPNMMFLSPFAGTSDRVPSESNLSTSGYSSMASPCHSRCPSVSPLCPDSDEYHIQGAGGHYMRRSSLTPSSSRKSSLTGATRRFSLNATSPLVSGGFMGTCSNYISFAEPCNNLIETERETETDSAVDVETETDAETARTPLAETVPITSRTNSELQISTASKVPSEPGSMINLLQVPRPKTLPKSRSLDMNVTALGTKLQQLLLEQRRGVPLRGDSLDSKLNSFDRTSPRPCPNISFLSFNIKPKGQEPAEQQQTQKKLTPLSSRSESPMSELNAGYRERIPGGLTSPMTDSDGPYDCASSEVQSNSGNPSRAGLSLSLNQLSPSQQIRRSGRRRNRRMSGAAGPKVASKNASPDSGNKRTDALCLNLNLPPSLAREQGRGGSRKGSPKRRTRAQPNLDGSSSSSAESLNSQRSHGSTSSMLTQESVGLPSDKPAFMHSSSPSSRSGSRLKRSPNVSCEDFSKSGSSFSKDQAEGNDDEVPGTSSSGMTLLKASRATATPPPPSSRRKVSRLRVIGLQIRFLRRLEQSLIRKREKITVSAAERRDGLLLSRTESLDSTLSSSSCCSICSSSCSTADGHGTSSGTSALSKFPSSTSIRDNDCHDDNDEDECDGTEQPLLSKSSSFTLFNTDGRKKSRKLTHTLSQSSLLLGSRRKKYK